MPIHNNSLTTAQTIYSNLSEKTIINEYVALLPISSYHVTLRGIKERYKCQSGKEYNEFVTSYYKKMMTLDQIFSEEFKQSDTIEFDFDISTVDKAPYAGLSLHFSQSKNKEECLRKLEDISINLLNLPLDKQSWHLTLGYFKNIPDKKQKKLIKQAVKEALNINSGKYTLYFSRPSVCHFNDMTNFELIT